MVAKLTKSQTEVVCVLRISARPMYVGEISKRLQWRPQDILIVLEDLADRGLINVSRFGGGMVRTAMLNAVGEKVWSNEASARRSETI